VDSLSGPHLFNIGVKFVINHCEFNLKIKSDY